jgi:hypoxanthine phosphoribosyltransferase
MESIYKPDLIVFIAKSGFLFARPLSEHFHCPIVDVIASREDNKAKDFLKKLIPWMPKYLLAILLKRRVSKSNYHEKSNRIVKGTSRFNQIDIGKYDKILLVDDSVDTGWSLLKVQEYLNANGAKDKFRTASYCVLSESENRVKVDFCRYKDQIVITATSRYSCEYRKFLEEYIGWKNEADTTFEV